MARRHHHHHHPGQLFVWQVLGWRQRTERSMNAATVLGYYDSPDKANAAVAAYELQGWWCLVNQIEIK